jgi:hypothetical protein
VGTEQRTVDACHAGLVDANPVNPAKSGASAPLASPAVLERMDDID